MNSMYSYLQKFKLDKPSFNDPQGVNKFYKVDEKNIKTLKKCIKLPVPEALVCFYKEIGWGHFDVSANGEVQESYSNLLLPPEDIQSILLDKESELLDPYTEFEEDELPFFEIADAASFLVMKPLSDNPNAVYDQCGDKIEDNFEDFIYNLYYKSPTYYLGIGLDEEAD